MYLFMTNLGKMNNCPIFLGRNCCKKVDFQFVNKCPEMLQFISEGPISYITEKDFLRWKIWYSIHLPPFKTFIYNPGHTGGSEQ